MSQVFIWTEGRSYGFALYGHCPLCGLAVRVGGYDAPPYTESGSVVDSAIAETTAEQLIELCALQNRAYSSCHINRPSEEW